MARYRSPLRRENPQRRRAQQRAAINRPKLPYEDGGRVHGPRDGLDPSTFPPSRTVIESTAQGAPFVITRYLVNGDAVRSEFYAGTGTIDRAITIANSCPDRAVVRHKDGADVLFDNKKTGAVRTSPKPER